MGFAPATGDNERVHREQCARAANEALRGETHNTGVITVPAGTGDFLIRDARLGVGKVLILTPLDAHAANAHWYVPEMLNGSARVVFTAHPGGDANYAYVICGIGNTKGV